jgi:hypothetical protein
MMKQNLAVRKWKPLTTLLSLAAAGACIGLTLPALSATTAEPCSTNPASRQLDYWLGDWNIAGPGSTANATSRVYLALDKCIVVESWDGGRGHRGENVFGYSPDDKAWHGMFADNQGRVHVFVDGKVTPGAAEFSGPSRGANGETILNRVRIVRISHDKVEQVWEKSSDNGATWTAEFRGEYSRRRP